MGLVVFAVTWMFYNHPHASLERLALVTVEHNTGYAARIINSATVDCTSKTYWQQPSALGYTPVHAPPVLTAAAPHTTRTYCVFVATMSKRIFADGKVWNDKLQIYREPTVWDKLDGLTSTPKMIFERNVTPRCQENGYVRLHTTWPCWHSVPDDVDPFAIFLGLHFGSVEVGRRIFSLGFGDNMSKEDEDPRERTRDVWNRRHMNRVREHMRRMNAP